MEKEFGCDQCGNRITAIPPDDIHTVLLVNKGEEKDCIETTYKCDDCNKDIIRYWCAKSLRHVGGALFKKTGGYY